MLKCKKLPEINKLSINVTAVYIDGIYFGEVVNTHNEKIEVECKNGNRYIDGKKIMLILTNPTKNPTNKNLNQ